MNISKNNVQRLFRKEVGQQANGAPSVQHLTK
ncbi:hypothetical protein TUST1-10_00380 [Vibrio phage ICP1_2004_A]|nr:hypothetical protein TUST1-159_00385 [Vibrio phage ICP1_2006_B]ADX88803.1 hypothetical protein TUST1-17_00385 [Vibrio phage ICP1_2006_A]ADX89029.1 hypothetical protein TUST1-15_00385 [Vibrio phage ICP1_2005_A]ADX89261.1 hypothetical protein TUST1-2_00395 [Vibrio phage ICP1_2001_A]ADX89488.1 hypothetical protein TUST1-10_00380 [Vibrio phage ICP1_2004_A]